ncbi:hypothetical protein WDV06_11995 [Streptomyces racemochromogenes]|uniref:Uncharacterized protein n=1 Tax=Streptomyces racemochromogenes TaxID=67353 RepID=A0ABW7PBQ9_9ACTN
MATSVIRQSPTSPARAVARSGTTCLPVWRGSRVTRAVAVSTRLPPTPSRRRFTEKVAVRSSREVTSMVLEGRAVSASTQDTT